MPCLLYLTVKRDTLQRPIHQQENLFLGTLRACVYVSAGETTCGCSSCSSEEPSKVDEVLALAPQVEMSQSPLCHE